MYLILLISCFTLISASLDHNESDLRWASFKVIFYINLLTI